MYNLVPSLYYVKAALSRVVSGLCLFFSFPPDWIKGDRFPRGIERNDDLSPQDIVHIRKLYGPPRGQPGGRVTPVPRPSTGGRGR